MLIRRKRILVYSGNDTTEHIQKRGLLVCVFYLRMRPEERLTVVVCDDDTFIIKSLRDLLDGTRYDVIGDASNGLDLVRLCREKNPDIVIVDIEMPVMDGITATKDLTENNLTKCVIVLTSFDDAEYIKGAIDTGAAGYLTKPISPDVLIPTIESCLRKSRDLYEMNKKVANINKRIETRGIIEKAQLLLMERHDLSEADAYGYIRSLSKERNTSMADIAEIIIAKYQGR